MTAAVSVKREGQKWSRLVHVYTSMVAFVVVLFFGITGLTLNHPEWTFGDAVDSSSVTGTLPMATTGPGGSVEFLAISEFVRATHAVSGSVSSYGVTSGKGSIVYKKPGYLADVSFDVGTGAYEVRVEQQGWIGVLNDLHKGRDSGTSWRWLIDVSAVFLVVVSLTGLLLQLFLRKRRNAAMIVMGAGAVLVVLLGVLTLR
jgi:hypothetical protein